MQFVYLEQLSSIRSSRQGRDLHDFVRLERDYLKSHRPKLYDLYHNDYEAAKAVKVIARAKRFGYEDYIIRLDRHNVARGVATIIRGQQVIHPEVGLVSGDVLTYTIGQAFRSNEFHRAIGTSLVYASGKPRLKPDPSKLQRGHNQVMILVQPNEQHDVRGLVENGHTRPAIQALGHVAGLSLPEGQLDTFHITRQGRPLQIYYGEGEVIEEPAASCR